MIFPSTATAALLLASSWSFMSLPLLVVVVASASASAASSASTFPAFASSLTCHPNPRGRFVRPNSSAAAAASSLSSLGDSRFSISPRFDGVGSTTALSMGLRSFIRGKLGKKKDGEGGEEEGGGDDGNAEGRGRRLKKKKEKGTKDAAGENDNGGGDDDDDDMDDFAAASPYSTDASKVPFAGDVSASATTSSSPSQTQTPIRQALPEDAPADSRSRGRASETVQERISRVKSGKMTEKEKAAFLRAALARPLDPRGAAPFGNNGVDDDMGEGSDRGGRARDGRGKPSPFPRETLWSTVIGRGDGSVSSSSASAATTAADRRGAVGGRIGPMEDLDDKAKRAYYDMVTNPDRFRKYGYSVAPRADDNGEAKSASEDAIEAFAEGDAALAGTKDSVVRDESAPDRSDEGSGSGSGVATSDYDDDNHEMAEGDDGDDKSGWGFFDLGSRLGAAAHAKEERDQKARAEAEAQEKRRREETQRLRDEEARRRIIDANRREAERAARRTEEEERAKRVEEERRKAEEERLAQMQAAQDAYWAKKLREERERMESKSSEEERKRKEKEEEMRAKAERTRREKAMAAEEERKRLKEEERKREDPHEGEILQEAQMDDLRERERNWQITEEQSAKVSHREPASTTPDVSASSFVSEQQRKLSEIARMKKDQEDRLRSMNSPLPSPGSTPRYGAYPRAPPSPSPSAASGGSSVRQVASLASLLNQKGGGASAPIPPPSAPAPFASQRLSLSEMTRLKKDDGGGGSGPASATSAVGSNRGIPSLSEMTRLKKDGAGGDASAADGRRPRTVRQNLPLSGSATTRKGGGPIRQRLPINNDDDDDDDDDDGEDDDLLRSGKGGSMSIGDYMKKGGGADAGSSGKREAEEKRSKMWGIDIDKIL